MAKHEHGGHRVNAPSAPVAHAILAQGALAPTHEELAAVGGVSTRSVANVVGALSKRGLICRGRPARLGPGMGLVVGVSMGTESLRAGLVDANGQLYAPIELPLSPGQLRGAPDHLLGRIRAVVFETLAHGSQLEELRVGEQGMLAIRGVAVAWPSPLNRDGFAGPTALRHPAWHRKDAGVERKLTLREHLASVLSPPFDVSTCHALNDVNAQALAVAFDKARQRAGDTDHDERWRMLMVVRVGGGLGAATVVQAPHNRRRLSFVDSRLIAGTNGYAGELGHLPIERNVVAQLNKDNPFGRDRLAPLEYERAVCSCGHKHHLEAFASGTALASRLRASGYGVDDDEPTGTGLLRRIFDGPLDDVQIHAVRDIGRLIGRTLASPILMLDPYSITFTGSVANDELEHGVLRERDFWANAVGDTVKIESLTPEQGGFAGVRGAALAVLRAEVYRRLEEIVVDKHPPLIRLRAAHIDALIPAP